MVCVKIKKMSVFLKVARSEDKMFLTVTSKLRIEKIKLATEHLSMTNAELIHLPDYKEKLTGAMRDALIATRASWQVR